MSTLLRLVYAAVFACALTAAQARDADDLVVGFAADVSSLDPHFLNAVPNVAAAAHIFDALVHVDPDGKLVPGLALSWQAVDPTTWEFKLRRGVKFHDGSEFTAEDVVFSLDRPAKVVNSPGPFTSYTRQIAAKQVVDAYTVRLKTPAPYGPLPLDLTTIYMVSKKAAAQASTEDFNAGRAAVGTGPFKFVAFRRGESIELARNDAYWGGKPAWQRVTLRLLTNDAARTAALLAGDVDAIEAVPTPDIARFKSNPAFRLEQKVSWRTIFWQMDLSRDQTPFVTDKAGRPLPHNPLRDLRVRQALSKAINRQALVERTMEGLAIATGNIVIPGIVGHVDALAPEPYDLAGAKRLLAEAGYPDGFALTLHGPNNRYVNDEQVVQTVAQMLTRAGIATRVETMPLSSYFGRARAGEFSFALLGWGSLAGDSALRSLLATPNPDIGWGGFNWGRYSNAELDKLVRAALGETDAARRADFAGRAVQLAMAERALIPLYHQYATWVMRKGLAYRARVDEFTLAQFFHPQ
ncbi:MAG: ABC transporter substrate-binding protein [Rhodocyclaceae bacterium]|nr:ABC transporter substrate-binding protein [Rhodocyclaceae bacterium]